MHRFKLLFLLLFIPLVVFGAAVPKTEVTLQHVTQRVSGDPVVVDGYRFYVSKIAGSKPGITPAATIPEISGELVAKLTALAPPPANGNHYVIATAYKGTEEGGSSNEVMFYAVGDGTYFIAAPLGVPGALQLR